VAVGVGDDPFEVRQFCAEPPEAAANSVPRERPVPARAAEHGPVECAATSRRVSSTIAGVR
jgi:hypothetical protein